MIGTVFGRNNTYGIASSSSNVTGSAKARLLAFTRSNSASLLDGALDTVAWQASQLAEKSSTNRYGKLVDIFA